jgi:long-chain acyl-CoA synthetase
MPITNLADVVRMWGRDTPGAPAVAFEGRTITYGELDERSNRVANALRAEGVGEQERVAFLGKNLPEYVDLVFGTAKINAVLAAVNWRLAPPEAAFIVNDTEAKVFVVGPESTDLLDAMRPALTAAKKIVVIGPDYDEWIASATADDPGGAARSDDVALQFYSSGTTGRPKGVMLTNGNLFASTDASGEALGFGRDSVNLVVMPLFHVAGGAWILLGLYFGVPNVLHRDVDPMAIAKAIAEHRVTHAVLVPAVMQFMLMIPECREADYSSLELLVYGASPISTEVLTDAMRTFGCRFMQAYGMTETTGGCVLLAPEDHDPDGPNAHRLRAAGKAGPNTELRIADPDTMQDVPTGEVGEILIRSPQNMAGYWKMPDATADTLLPDGWLRTGDVGYLDDDGYLYIHDRVKDMIISGGENVYPAEVEDVLMRHPAVADVAVIGVPDDTWGEVGKALVVKAVGAEVTEADLIEHCRTGLARFKCPRSVEWRDVLPRNPSGKLLKRELREPYWEGRERKVH